MELTPDGSGVDSLTPLIRLVGAEVRTCGAPRREPGGLYKPAEETPRTCRGGGGRACCRSGLSPRTAPGRSS